MADNEKPVADDAASADVHAMLLELKRAQEMALGLVMMYQRTGIAPIAAIAAMARTVSNLCLRCWHDPAESRARLDEVMSMMKQQLDADLLHQDADFTRLLLEQLSTPKRVM